MTTAAHRAELSLGRSRRIGARLWLPTLAWAAALVTAILVDRAAFLHLTVTDVDARRALESKDWYRLLRILGSMWTWLGVGAAMMMIDRARIRAGAGIRGGWTRRGVVLISSAFFAGAAAEAAKPLIGRLRPESADGMYVFMPIAERLQWAWSDLGLPSSHAAVAFGAAFALCFKYRAAAPLFLLGAAGCGTTRVAVGQHFVSDVLVAAWIAYAVAVVVWRIDARNNGGIGLGEPGTGVGGEAWINRVGASHPRAADQAAASASTNGGRSS